MATGRPLHKIQQMCERQKSVTCSVLAQMVEEAQDINTDYALAFKYGHEAARAADKARIAELEAALSIDLPKLLDRLDEALEDIELHGRHSDRGYHQLSGWYKNARRITSAIDAALAQQGKEGEV